MQQPLFISYHMAICRGGGWNKWFIWLMMLVGY